jgi:hypothetical protein
VRLLLLLLKIKRYTFLLVLLLGLKSLSQTFILLRNELVVDLKIVKGLGEGFGYFLSPILY